MAAVVITGVSSGIGYDAADHLIDKGYFVFGSVRDDGALARLESIFPARSFKALLFDVTDKTAIAGAREYVRTAMGGRNLRALINNAGMAVAGPMQLLDDDQFRQQMEVSLFGVRNVTNAFLPLLGANPEVPLDAPRRRAHHPAQRPGKIINISSLSGILNTPMNGAYCVAKHALESLGEVYRRELIDFGIDVVSIRPGPIQSCIWDKNMEAPDAYADTAYATMAVNTKKIIAQAQRDALPAAVVSKLIREIIEARRTKCAYVVHKNKWLPVLLANYLPARLVDWLIWRTVNAPLTGGCPSERPRSLDHV